ncbi:MAG TPA: hypothetical protein VGL49_06590 [Acidimicrobiales bacterium]|jgi:hypothetical protein
MYLHPSLLNDLAAANRDNALRLAARPRPDRDPGRLRDRRRDRSRAAPRLGRRPHLSRSM